MYYSAPSPRSGILERDAGSGALSAHWTSWFQLQLEAPSGLRISSEPVGDSAISAVDRTLYVEVCLGPLIRYSYWISQTILPTFRFVSYLHLDVLFRMNWEVLKAGWPVPTHLPRTCGRLRSLVCVLEYMTLGHIWISQPTKTSAAWGRTQVHPPAVYLLLWWVRCVMLHVSATCVGVSDCSSRILDLHWALKQVLAFSAGTGLWNIRIYSRLSLTCLSLIHTAVLWFLAVCPSCRQRDRGRH